MALQGSGGGTVLGARTWDGWTNIVSQTGKPGKDLGGGGSGGIVGTAATAAAGGIGDQGVVIVETYF